MADFSEKGINERLDFLVKQSCGALDLSVANFKKVVFPCALIAGDVVILHLLHKQGLLQSGQGVIFCKTRSQVLGLRCHVFVVFLLCVFGCLNFKSA